MLTTKKGLHRLKTVCGKDLSQNAEQYGFAGVRLSACVRIVFAARDMWDSNVSFSRCWLGATALDSQPLAQSAELSQVDLGVQVNLLLVEVTCYTWLIFVSLF